MIQYVSGKWQVHYARTTYAVPTLTLAQSLLRALITDYYNRQALTICERKAGR